MKLDSVKDENGEELTEEEMRDIIRVASGTVPECANLIEALDGAGVPALICQSSIEIGFSAFAGTSDIMVPRACLRRALITVRLYRGEPIDDILEIDRKKKTPPRGLFHVSLTTCLVLMLLLGFLLMMNLSPDQVGSQGWPFTVRVKTWDGNKVSGGSLFLNLMFGFLTAVIAGLSCERWVRRVPGSNPGAVKWVPWSKTAVSSCSMLRHARTCDHQTSALRAVVVSPAFSCLFIESKSIRELIAPIRLCARLL